MIPGLGRFPGEGNGDPLQYSCLENPTDGGAWWATVHGVAKSWTRLSDLTFTFTFHQLSLSSQVVQWSRIRLSVQQMEKTQVQSLGPEELPGEGNGNPLQYSCLENPIDRGSWRATVHGAAKSWTLLSMRACTHTHTHTPPPNYLDLIDIYRTVYSTKCTLSSCSSAPDVFTNDHVLSRKTILSKFKVAKAGTSLVVQWLRLSASTVGGTGSNPTGGTKILKTVWCSQNKR